MIGLNFGFIQLNVGTLNTENVVLISERRPEKEVDKKLNLNPITFFIKHSDTLPQGRREPRGLLGQGGT